MATAVETQEPVYMLGTLSNSDLRLVKLLCLPNKVIADNLGVSSANAVGVLISRIGDKLFVENRTAIVVRALRLGLISIDQLVYRSYNGGTNLS